MLYVGPEAYVKLLVVCQRQGYGYNNFDIIQILYPRVEPSSQIVNISSSFYWAIVNT